jgi:hypoxanthine phosphoribosyltransferase
MDKITILDKIFRTSIGSQKIAERVKQLADELNSDLKNKDVIFIGILNGAFMFASDLLKNITFQCSITFLKLASYEGLYSTGQVKQLIGLNDNLKDKTVVVIEDIIETGNSINSTINFLKGFNPKEIKVAGLLYKPDSYKFNYQIDYIGFTIPNDFVIGYGLDYKGYGRNLNDIFTVVDTK